MANTGVKFGYFLRQDPNTPELPLPALGTDRIAVVRGSAGSENTYWAHIDACSGGVGIVADGVWSPTTGATVALGSDTVTVSGAAFTAADIGKRFTMMRGGSSQSFAGARIIAAGTGYRAGDVISLSGASANIWSVTAVAVSLTSGGSGGPPSATFNVAGAIHGRRGGRDSARLTVTTNASGVVTTIALVKGGVYSNPTFTGINTLFESKDYPGLTGMRATLTLAAYDIRRQAACFYGRITGTTLTVEELVYGAIAVGQSFKGIEVIEGTTITALGTGTGGLGTYTLSSAHTGMSDNIWLFISETVTTTTTPGSGTVSPTGGSGTGLSVTPIWWGAPLVGNIIDYLSPTSVRLDVTAASAATSVGYCYGTDHGPAIQAALDAGQEVNLPAGVVCHSVPLILKDKSRLVGKGSALGNDASTVLAYVGPYVSRGKQISADEEAVVGRIGGMVVGELLLWGSNLIGIGLFVRGAGGNQIRPMSISGHTYIGVQLSGGVDGASVGNIHSHLVVREDDAPGMDVTGIYIGPGAPNPDDMTGLGYHDVCRTLFPYWQVDVDMTGFGRPVWYRVADSNSHSFVKLRGPADLPGVEFGSHNTHTQFARAIHFSYLDAQAGNTRLRAGTYPSTVGVSFQNFLNGGRAAEVDGTPDAAGAIEGDDPGVVVDFGAQFFSITNMGTLYSPRLQPFHFASRQEPRVNSWMLYPITDSNTSVPGAPITATGSYSVLAYTDASEVLRVLSPASLPTAATYTVGTLPAGTPGMRAIVSDALAPVFLATVAAGGAVRAPVFWDDGGSAWKVG